MGVEIQYLTLCAHNLGEDFTAKRQLSLSTSNW
jgi:hypothetical protein